MTRSPLPLRLLALLHTALAALLYRLLCWLDGVPGSGADCGGTATASPPSEEFDTRMDSWQWAEAQIAELYRKLGAKDE